MKALIDPRSDMVADIAAHEFPVAAPLFWVDAANGVVAGVTKYIDDQFVQPEPLPVEPPPVVVDPVQKLAAFLAANPDVDALLKSKGE